ncbi:MAG: oligoendopeptidase F [Bacilli bacterium]
MEKQRTRDEIEEKYKWDLTTIYKSDEEFNKELKNVKEELEKVTNYKGNIVNSSKNLYTYLTESDALERRLYKLYYYAHLNFDSETTNPKNQELQGSVDNLLQTYGELTSFVTPELLSVEYDKIKEYYNEEPRLLEYEFNLECIYRYKSHTLDEKSEKILSTFSKVLGSPEDCYDALTDSDMTFGNITIDGKETELTESNYSKYIKNTDKNVRKEAFTRLFSKYGEFKNTITKTFKGNIDALVAEAKIRNYNSSIEASLYSDNIDVSVYNNLIDTVSNNMDKIYKYFNLKKKILGIKDYHIYDVYLDMIPKFDKHYEFEEAKSLVINALKPLGEDYIEILNKAFDERWIDIYNNKGKRGGAYSSGFYDTNPFVLLNYEGTYHDVSTLAHELGHSMHTYYSCHNNPYQQSNYKIFVAEVASTVNELLLAKYMLKNSKEKEEKLFILNQLLELYKSTIYRQTMFAEFEQLMHKKVENDEVLTYENISNEYYKLNQKYFGDTLVLDDLIKYEWERIPHFYYNFYVYKYAIGLSCATKIVDDILNNKENAVENYKNFLKSGGSDYPANELLLANVDVKKKETIESALNMFDSLIDEFETIYNS